MIAAGVAERIVDLLELVDVDHQQRHLTLMFGGGGEPGRQILMQRIAIGEPGQGVVLGEIANSFRFAVAHRNVPQHRAILEAVGARPAEEAGVQRKGFAIASATRELHHLAAGRLQVRLRQIENRECRTGDGAVVLGKQPVQGAADHVAGTLGRKSPPRPD